MGQKRVVCGVCGKKKCECNGNNIGKDKNKKKKFGKRL